MAAPHLDKIEELVERSKGDMRADKVHDKLTVMGYGDPSARAGARSQPPKAPTGAGTSASSARGPRTPGLWFQWDWGAGPLIWERKTQLWCAWLAWSRFRVITPAALGELRREMPLARQ
jgi:hypothetical protein